MMVVNLPKSGLHDRVQDLVLEEDFKAQQQHQEVAAVVVAAAADPDQLHPRLSLFQQ